MGILQKSAEKISNSDLDKINRHTRRALLEEEIYCFKVVLCDNDIDRDWEQFSVEALHTLADLFVGKTGIFDHEPKGKNQSARIFALSVEQDTQKQTKTGEVYHYLLAKAYTVRSDKNADLILEIDAGIKKEVSVGCNVSKMRCSICGTDHKKSHCNHTKGAYYQNKLCYTILEDPIDAYEWSFVAVPAQKNAGVVKQFEADMPSGFTMEKTVTDTQILEKLFDTKPIDTERITLEKQQIVSLQKKMHEMQDQAKFAKKAIEQMKERVRRQYTLKHKDVRASVIASLVEKMSVEELSAFDVATHQHAAPQLKVFNGAHSFAGKNANAAFKLD